MSDTINIFSVTDDNYAPYCGVMLTSVFENNKNYSLKVFIFISKPLTKRNQNKFHKLEIRYGNSIEFITVDDYSIRKLSISNIWSIATFYKVFAGDLLPDSIHKVLYLDGDIIVTGDLAELWDIDITGQAMAVVQDYCISCERGQYRLQYPIEAGYFNGGMMLINLDYWRLNNVGRRCLTYIENNYDKLIYCDQDVLNAVLWNEKRFIPLTYNYLISYLGDYHYYRQSLDIQKEIIKFSKSPLIIHYCGPILKPWSVVYYSLPFSEEWKSYKRLSPWSHKLSSPTKNKPINWIIKRYILWPCGIMKPNFGFNIIKKQDEFR